MKLSINKVLAILAVVLVVGLVLFNINHHATPHAAVSQNTLASTPGDAASGDTNAESLRELTAQYQKVVKENQHYQQQLTTMSQHASVTTNGQIDNARLQSVQQAQADTQQQIKQLQTQLMALQEQNNTGNTDKNNNGNSYPVNGASGQSPSVGIITTITDMRSEGASASSSMNGFTHEQTSHVTNVNHEENAFQQQQDMTVPYYTIPALSNLANTVLMTSLIGEVPQGSTFAQPPFPFLALVGKHDLLAANGMVLPSDLAGMKIAGYSVGVGSFLQGIACTRAYITQVLFVFDDGTSFTVQGKNTSGSNINPDDTLGYLSDPYGNPCIQGKYITNADRMIAMLTGAGFADGVAKGISESQTDTLTGFDGSTNVFNGSIGKYAAGNGVSTGVEDAANYMQQRLKGTFDVVYVPASLNGIPTHVIANFTQTIPIDLNKTGRKIRYDNNANSQVSLVAGLD